MTELPAQHSRPYRLLTAVAGLWLAGMAASATGQLTIPPGPIPGPARQLGGAIAGRVIGATGQGLVGVRVHAVRELDTEADAEVEIDESMLQTSTSEHGSYLLEDLPTGHYRVRFTGVLGIPGEEAWFRDQADLEHADVVEVSAGQTVTGIDLVVPKPGAITGRVADPSGRPLVGFKVSAVWSERGISEDAQTDENGLYHIGPLPPGSYEVLVWSAQMSDHEQTFHAAGGAPDQHQLVVVQEGRATAGVDITVRRTTSAIHGRVTDPSGIGIRWVSVSVRDEQNNQVGSGLTDEQGVYVVHRLPAGRHRVELVTYASGDMSTRLYLGSYYNGKDFRHADRVEVPAAVDVTGIDAILDKGGTISGHVTDATGRGVARVFVTASSAGRDGSQASTSTEADGSYLLPRLVTGSYRVQFYPRDVKGLLGQTWERKPFLGDHRFDNGDLIQVTLGQDTRGIDAELAGLGGIAGRVTATDGKGIAGVRVFPHDARPADPDEPSLHRSPSWWSGDPSIASTVTDGQGSFTLRDLSPGEYRMRLELDTEDTHITQWYPRALHWAEAAPVIVEAGATRLGVDCTLHHGGLLTGRVRDPGGTPIPGVDVSVIDPKGRTVKRIRTLSDGRYHVRLTEGDYRLHFEDLQGKRFLSRWSGNKPRLDQAALVRVRPNRKAAGGDVRLVPGGGISGRITDTSGRPVKLMQVVVTDPSGTNLASAKPFDDGRYSASPLPAGTFLVSAMSTSDQYFYARVWHPAAGTASGAEPVRVVPGVVTPGVDFVFGALGGIRGRVVNPEGEGVGSTRLQLVDHLQHTVTYATADASGAFRLDGLGPGRYGLGFQPGEATDLLPGWYRGKSATAELDWIVVGDGEETDIGDIPLARGASISGRVLGPDGLPAPYIEVRVLGPRFQVGMTQTGVDGRYEIRRLEAGTYHVSFGRDWSTNAPASWYLDAPTESGATPVTLSRGQRLAGIDTIQRSGGAIAGTVRDPDDKPVTDFVVKVFGETGPALTEARTDALGTFEARCLPPGPYKVLFHTNYRDNLLSEYWNARGSRATADPVSVAGDQTTTGIDACLSKGGSLTGRVTNAQGNGVGSIEVWAYDATQERAAMAHTRPDGGYALIGLRTGSYKILADGSSLRLVSVWYPHAAAFEAATPLALEAGTEMSGLDIRLGP